VLIPPAARRTMAANEVTIVFSSRAATPEAYLSELPDTRRQALAAVRAVVLKNLPKGYQESMGYGILTYCIPLADHPDTYNGQPLCYVALGAHKNYCSLYLMSAYGDPKEAAWLASAFKRAGKKLDMGKSCVHFKTADDLPLDVIGRFIARTKPKTYIARCERARAAARSKARRRSR
jgi:hypothetical protein